jgi:hypothetical protein
MRGGIWRAAILMREARGLKAAEEAASRALSYRSRGDEAGFDVWSLVFLAIRALEGCEPPPAKIAPGRRSARGAVAGRSEALRLSLELNPQNR